LTPNGTNPGEDGRERMELDVRLDIDLLSITIDDPFRLDIDDVIARIDAFLAARGTARGRADIRGLLPLMVKGIAGCEEGCPANARELVEQGYQNFALQYIEGGILTAMTKMADGKALSLKLFPDF
jgi:hypothetical protein